jgi:hypothetical protein
MLRFSPPKTVEIKKPSLIVTIDAEEEFNWQKLPSRIGHGFDHIPDILHLQNIFDKHALSLTPLSCPPKAVICLATFTKKSGVF